MSNVERVVYELLFEFKDGRPSYRSGNYTDKGVAERAAAHKKAYYGFKRVTVIERRFTPGGQSFNACMLTVAR